MILALSLLVKQLVVQLVLAHRDEKSGLKIVAFFTTSFTSRH